MKYIPLIPLSVNSENNKKSNFFRHVLRRRKIKQENMMRKNKRGHEKTEKQAEPD
jgi:hypothetical protein